MASTNANANNVSKSNVESEEKKKAKKAKEVEKNERVAQKIKGNDKKTNYLVLREVKVFSDGHKQVQVKREKDGVIGNIIVDKNNKQVDMPTEVYYNSLAGKPIEEVKEEEVSTVEMKKSVANMKKREANGEVFAKEYKDKMAGYSKKIEDEEKAIEEEKKETKIVKMTKKLEKGVKKAEVEAKKILGDKKVEDIEKKADDFLKKQPVYTDGKGNFKADYKILSIEKTVEPDGLNKMQATLTTKLIGTIADKVVELPIIKDFPNIEKHKDNFVEKSEVTLKVSYKQGDRVVKGSIDSGEKSLLEGEQGSKKLDYLDKRKKEIEETGNE